MLGNQGFNLRGAKCVLAFIRRGSVVGRCEDKAATHVSDGIPLSVTLPPDAARSSNSLDLMPASMIRLSSRVDSFDLIAG